MPCGYVHFTNDKRESVSHWCFYICCVRLLHVCSFYYTGQCEGLYKRNEQQYGSHAFSFYRQKEEHWQVNTTGMKRIRSKSISYYLLFLCLCASGAISSMCISSCSSTKTIALSCQERQIEIYVDDEYLGRDLVYYTVSRGREYIEVSCRENGLEVYHRRINVKNRNGNLIELQIPKNYKYSSKPY